MVEKPESFAVIGLGTFGSTVARDLTEYGDTVLGIDIQKGPVNDLAGVLRETVVADGRDDEALREAGVGQCTHAIVAIGKDLEASIVTAMNVKMIGVKEIWAMAESKTHHRILSRLGVDRVIQPSRQMGQRAAQMLHNPLVRDYLSLGNGFYAISILLPETFAGKKLSEVALEEQYNVQCLEVMRGSESLSPGKDDPVLEAEDRMLILGRRADLRALSDDL